MSTNSPQCQSEFAGEKRALLYWIARLIDEDVQFDNVNLDIPEISVLLQCMGFRLEAFEKDQDNENVPLTRNSLNLAEKSAIRVELSCPKSGMKSTMIKQTQSCKCPSENEVDKGQFWSVTGCTPNSQNSINSSNCSLLPSVAPVKIKIIKTLLLKVLLVIGNTDVKETEEVLPSIKNLSMTRHRSLDTLRKSGDSIDLSRGLKRGPSWEVDPTTSPPIQTSSPVPSLCATMSRISLSCGQSSFVVKNLESMKKLVDETLEAACGGNATFIKSGIPKKRVSDIKPTEGPSVNEFKPPASTPSSSRTTPRRVLTPRKTLQPRITPGERQSPMAPPSKIATLRKKTLVSSISPRSPGLVKKDTPRPRSYLLKPNLGTAASCDSIFKSKTIGAKPNVSPRVGRAQEAGTSGIAKIKNVGKMTLNAIAPAKKKT